MPKEKIELLIDGGEAKAGAEIGGKLGPLGLNVQAILKDINDKTIAFKGMKVPVTLIIDTKDKTYKIEIGTPPISQLIKKELGLEKGSSQPDKEKIGNLSIEQVIKLAKMKSDSMLTKTMKASVKSVIGSANSLGILVEGLEPVEINPLINSGNYDTQILSEITETSMHKLEQLKKQLEEKNIQIQKELAKLKALEEKPAEVKKEEVKAEGEVAAETKEAAPEAKKETVKETKKEEKKQKK